VGVFLWGKESLSWRLCFTK